MIEIKDSPINISNFLLTPPVKDKWPALIFIKNDRRYIIHNPTHSPARQESKLMHELTHATCNHELCELETAIAG